MILKINSEVSPVVITQPIKTISGTVQATQIQEEQSTCLPKIAKLILVHNLITFCLLMTIVPVYLMQLIVYLGDKDFIMYGKLCFV